jgi:SSS family solute:Na+ symporter
VAYTEALQTIILVIGSALVTWFGLKALGGWGELRAALGSDAFNLWDPLLPEGVRGVWSPVVERDDAGKVVEQAWYFTHDGNFPWIGMLFCAPIIGLWYWCTDQYIVQRALGAPNEQQARRGSIFASFLKLLPVFIFIVPGMISVALAKSGNYPTLSGLIDADGNVINDEAQRAFPLLIGAVLPEGVRGVVVAGLLAALMSSLAGVFNASSTLFTMDFYSKLHPSASQQQLVWIGRVATAVMVLIGLAWIPVIQGAEGLYAYLQGVQAYLAPPIFVVFFLGVFWKRLNGPGCMAALIIGFLMGLLRLVVDTPVALKLQGFENGWTEGSFPWIVNQIYFQYYSLLIFLVSIAAMVIISYVTPAPSEEKLRGLTFGTLTEEHRRESRASWSAADVIASCVVMVAIIAAYIYFRG